MLDNYGIRTDLALEATERFTEENVEVRGVEPSHNNSRIGLVMSILQTCGLIFLRIIRKGGSGNERRTHKSRSRPSSSSPAPCPDGWKQGKNLQSIRFRHGLR